MSNENNEEKKQEITVSSLMPNLRFGTSFLDTKYRDRAALGEVLMDKRTGEVVLDRRTDGSFIYFDREQPKLDDYFLEISQLIKSDVDFIFPEINDKDVLTNVHFLTTLIDAHDFRSEFDNIENQMDISGIMYNDSDDTFTVSSYQNGFFIKVKPRPRDIPLLDFYGMMYNNYLENYEGTDEELKAHKELLKTNPDFKYANVKVTYTIIAYTEDSNPIKNITKSDYIRADENVLLKFYNQFESGQNYKYFTLHIDSIQFPKLKNMRDKLLIGEKEYVNVYNTLLDDNSIEEDSMAVTHIYVSYFSELSVSPYTAFPTNSRVISSLPLKVFEESFNMVDNLSSSGGVHISSSVPDELTLSRIILWIERFRNVGEKGITEQIEEFPETDPDDLEKFFGQCENVRVKFTPLQSSLDDIFVNPHSKGNDYTVSW